MKEDSHERRSAEIICANITRDSRCYGYTHDKKGAKNLRKTATKKKRQLMAMQRKRKGRMSEEKRKIKRLKNKLK